MLPIVALYLPVSIFLAAKLNIWIDEAYSLATTSTSFGHTLHQALYFEDQPPFYFLALHAWQTLDHSIFFARLFSVLCIGLTLVLTNNLSKRYFPSISSSFVIAGLALNPFLLWAALEIRVYALVILLTAIVQVAFLDAYWGNQRSQAARVIFVCGSIVGLYTQYYFAFLLIGLGFILALRGLAVLKKFSIDLAITVLAFSPMLLTLPQQFHTATVNQSVNQSLFQAFHEMAQIVLRFVIPAYALPHFAPTVFLICLALGFASVQISSKRWRQDDNWYVPAVLAFTIFLLETATLVLTHQQITSRYAAVMFVPFGLAVYGILANSSPVSRFAVPVWTVLMLLLSAGTLYQTYEPLAKAGDWQRVASYITAHEQPQQPVLVFEASAALPLSHYYAGVNALAPVPAPLELKRFNPRDNVLATPAQIDRVLSTQKYPIRELWLVRTAYCKWLSVDFGCAVLNSYVHDNFQVVRNVPFYGSTVQLLRRR